MESWENGNVNAPLRNPRPDVAPALYRLLAESALSRAALGSCGVPVAIVDAGRTRAVSYVNAAFQALFGYGESEALGRSLAKLVFRGDDGLVQRVLGDGPRRWELSAWAKDGSLFHVEATIAGLRDAAGALSHWVVAFADRTELERLRAEVESLKSLAAASLGVHLDAPAEPARSAQEPCVEVAAADELHAHRQTPRILQQR